MGMKYCTFEWMEQQVQAQVVAAYLYSILLPPVGAAWNPEMLLIIAESVRADEKERATYFYTTSHFWAFWSDLNIMFVRYMCYGIFMVCFNGLCCILLRG